MNQTPKRVKVLGDLFHGVVPPGAVYIGRGLPGLPKSPWYNPFVRGGDRQPKWTAPLDKIYVATQGQAVDLYMQFVDANPEYRARARADLYRLDLACWCKPEMRCHGDVLLVVANWPEGTPWSPLFSA